jgi:hypothetical protein
MRRAWRLLSAEASNTTTTTTTPAAPAAGAPAAETAAPPVERVRTAAQKWRTRAVLGALGLVGAGLYHQLAYAKTLRVYREALAMVETDDRVTSVTGDLEGFKWYEPQGITGGWEWRPATLWRRLLWGCEASPSERRAVSSFALRGELANVSVAAEAVQRGTGRWQLIAVTASVADQPLVLLDRRLVLPQVRS